MKSILPLVILSLTIIGCSKYQYAEITSSTGVDSTGRIITENDSFRISYAFSGLEGLARLHIYNKLDVPLYVSWDQSALVLDDQVIGRIKKNTLAINESAYDGKIRWHRKMSSTADSVKLTWAQIVTEIPSKSEITSDFIYLGSKFFERSTSNMQERRHNESVVKFKNYSRSDSPLQFRSYLMISLSNDFLNSKIIETNFWVSEVSVTDMKPVQMGSYSNRANVYYISKPTVATEVVSSFLILGSVGFLTATKE